MPRELVRTVAAAALVALGVLTMGAATSRAQDPFADEVAAFTPGINGEFGTELLPGIVLGPPRGAGPTQGSLDVVALGSGGTIVLRFAQPVICDGPGPDFTVFENAFHSGTATGPLFAEYGFVAVSQDGETFVEFPYDAASHAGLAGQQPILSNPDNGVDPLDPTVSGGDQFDLATVGLPWAAYVRVTDVAGAVADPGDLPQFSVAPNAGFDLDAIAALHACEPEMDASATPTPTATPPPAITATVSATPSTTHTESATPTTPDVATETPVPSATATAEATASATTPTPIVGDLDGDGAVTAADVSRLIREIFDGDGDRAADARQGASDAGPAADVNADGAVTSADLTAIAKLRGD